MINLLATTLGVTSLRMATMPSHRLAKNVDEEQHSDGSHFKPWTLLWKIRLKWIARQPQGSKMKNDEELIKNKEFT
jgi:hypothetical protein